jgi:hypothetical protein
VAKERANAAFALLFGVNLYRFVINGRRLTPIGRPFGVNERASAAKGVRFAPLLNRFATNLSGFATKVPPFVPKKVTR